MNKFTEKEIEILASIVTREIPDGCILFSMNGVFHFIEPGKNGEKLTMVNGIPQWK